MIKLLYRVFVCSWRGHWRKFSTYPTRGACIRCADELLVKIEKGPAEVLRGLTSDDPELRAGALDFQNQAFRARFGCYPWELEDELGRKLGDKRSEDEDGTN